MASSRAAAPEHRRQSIGTSPAPAGRSGRGRWGWAGCTGPHRPRWSACPALGPQPAAHPRWPAGSEQQGVRAARLRGPACAAPAATSPAPPPALRCAAPRLPSRWLAPPAGLPGPHLLGGPQRAGRVPCGRRGRRAGGEVPLFAVPLDAPRQQVHLNLGGACTARDACLLLQPCHLTPACCRKCRGTVTPAVRCSLQVHTPASTCTCACGPAAHPAATPRAGPAAAPATSMGSTPSLPVRRHRISALLLSSMRMPVTATTACCTLVGTKSRRW